MVPHVSPTDRSQWRWLTIHTACKLAEYVNHNKKTKHWTYLTVSYAALLGRYYTIRSVVRFPLNKISQTLIGGDPGGQKGQLTPTFHKCGVSYGYLDPHFYLMNIALRLPSTFDVNLRPNRQQSVLRTIFPGNLASALSFDCGNFPELKTGFKFMVGSIWLKRRLIN